MLPYISPPPCPRALQAWTYVIDAARRTRVANSIVCVFGNAPLRTFDLTAVSNDAITYEEWRLWAAEHARCVVRSPVQSCDAWLDMALNAHCCA